MRTLAALCLVALTLAGCGAASQDSSKDFTGAKRSVASVVEDLETAARKNDAKKVCGQLLSKSLLEALTKKGTNCLTGVKQAFKDADSFDIKVDDVTISGQTATAKVTSGTSGSEQKHDTLLLQRDGQTWKISALQS